MTNRILKACPKVGLLVGLAWALAGLGGCASSNREPRNLSLLKEEIISYVDSGRYLSQVRRISTEAIDWIENRAKKAETERSGARLAVVFDLDETLLSNLPHMRAMDFGYQPAAWDAWVERGEAPAIEPVREIYRRVRQLGLSVIFITARHEHDRPGTEKNLSAIGAGDYEGLVFKPDGSKETARSFKTNARRELLRQGFTIVANIGDQTSDLAGGYAEHLFKLPAPFYLSP